MESTVFLLVVLTLVTSFDSISGQNGVIQNIRLAGAGSNNTYGRVEVQINGEWGTVCDDGWDQTNNLAASVVCRFLGFINGGRAISNFGGGIGGILLDDVLCQGDESNLDDCRRKPGVNTSDCNHAEDVGVSCIANTQQLPATTTTTQRPVGPQPGNCAIQSQDIRLIAPQGIRGIGVVEVNNGGTWGTVCDDNWDELDARVVCRMLCYNTLFARPGALDEYINSVTSSNIIVDNVRCTGNENRLQDCPHNPWNNHDCGPTEKASVTCVDLESQAPDPPEPILECKEGYLTARFRRSRDSFLEAKHLTIVNPGTTCRMLNQTDNVYVTIRIPFEECNTRVTSNATHIIYSNVVRYAATHDDGNKVRVNTYLVNVFCDMPRDEEASRDLEPITQSVFQRSEGKFVIQMTFYQNNSFTNPVNQYPLRLPLGEWLNVALQLESVDSRLKLIVPDCLATPTNSTTTNTPTYPLFQDNCPNEPTLGFFPLNQTKFGYRYQPFKFVNYPNVYLTCGAFVCLLDETTAECDRSCNTTKPSAAGRRKREAGTPKEKYYIHSGPLVVFKPSNVETSIERIDGISQTFSTTISIPLSKEITEKLRTTTPKPTKNPTTSSTPKPTTKPTKQTTTLGRVVSTVTHSSTTSRPATRATSTPYQKEKDYVKTTPSTQKTTTSLKGVWIEYPRRQTTERSNVLETPKDDSLKLQSEARMSEGQRLRFGVNGATSAMQMISVIINLVLFILFFTL